MQFLLNQAHVMMDLCMSIDQADPSALRAFFYGSPMPPKKRPLDPALVALGRRIAEMRKRKGLAQAHLAESVGVAIESISRIERAAAVPSLPLLIRIASALEVPLGDLLAAGPIRSVPRTDPETAKLIALVASKAPDVRRRVLKIVRLVLVK